MRQLVTPVVYMSATVLHKNGEYDPGTILYVSANAGHVIVALDVVHGYIYRGKQRYSFNQSTYPAVSATFRRDRYGEYIGKAESRLIINEKSYYKLPAKIEPVPVAKHKPMKYVNRPITRKRK